MVILQDASSLAQCFHAFDCHDVLEDSMLIHTMGRLVAAPPWAFHSLRFARSEGSEGRDSYMTLHWILDCVMLFHGA